jgi:hypothetical protein
MRHESCEVRSSSGTMDQQGIIQREDKRFRRCICACLCPSQLAVDTSVPNMTYNASRNSTKFASCTPYFTSDVP